MLLPPRARLEAADHTDVRRATAAPLRPPSDSTAMASPRMLSRTAWHACGKASSWLQANFTAILCVIQWFGRGGGMGRDRSPRPIPPPLLYLKDPSSVGPM